eukprot:TRINITY_DN9956_c0_g1_i1.p2 TRINITY_DN9956_c0_g1~~TRINITY_DN9956_c0_g1_i1.p2  ORF type:complete len:161 (+),score=10.06 TRINITY_DN9956_c0_g1_i1:764-1246(+)
MSGAPQNSNGFSGFSTTVIFQPRSPTPQNLGTPTSVLFERGRDSILLVVHILIFQSPAMEQLADRGIASGIFFCVHLALATAAIVYTTAVVARGEIHCSEDSSALNGAVIASLGYLPCLVFAGAISMRVVHDGHLRELVSTSNGPHLSQHQRRAFCLQPI